MKNLLIHFCIAVIISFKAICGNAEAIIIDHNCCKITDVPASWVETSKTQFKIAYGHTSHGSQIPTGMDLLAQPSGSIYQYNNGSNTLYLNDASALSGDLGNPDRTTWAEETRTLLNNNTLNINMIMWSWCGQVDGSQNEINTYLSLMNQLEIDYPQIKFVYMTGHLNGSGVEGNVNVRNEQIRKYCRDNAKILFDFADIESYDPDGNYFLAQEANDGCDYNGGNWAEQWCEKHPGECDFSCSCAHSHCLNCYQKGKAFWWMLARVAGWDGKPNGVNENNNDNKTIMKIQPNPANDFVNITIFKGLRTGQISIFNSLGIEVAKFSNDSQTEGNMVRISTKEFPAGIYYCTFNGCDGKTTETFAVIK